MTQIAFVAYPGFTALDMIGPYEVLRNLPDAEVRFVWHEVGPFAPSGRPFREWAAIGSSRPESWSSFLKEALAFPGAQ